MAKSLPQNVLRQIQKAGLPSAGPHPFKPKLGKNRKGKMIIKKDTVQHGPKKGKRGFVDDQGRIWIRDRAHADVPDHWDIQEDGGKTYVRVDDSGHEIP